MPFQWGERIAEDNRLPVDIGGGTITLGAVLAVTPNPAAQTDRSGTITSANVSQAVIGSAASRNGFIIQNVSSADDMWVNTSGGAASAGPGSFRIGPGEWISSSMNGGPIQSVSILCATAGAPFTAKEW